MQRLRGIHVAFAKNRKELYSRSNATNVVQVLNVKSLHNVDVFALNHVTTCFWEISTKITRNKLANSKIVKDNIYIVIILNDDVIYVITASF